MRSIDFAHRAHQPEPAKTLSHFGRWRMIGKAFVAVLARFATDTSLLNPDIPNIEQKPYLASMGIYINRSVDCFGSRPL